MTTFIFVRHGQSRANLERIFAGHTDTPLTDLGHKQAQNTARFLEQYPIEKIYSSDLLRSMQTAEPTARHFGLPVIPDCEMREIYAGEWEGKLYEDLMKEYHEEYETWIKNCGCAHPNGGESVAELGERIYSECDRLLAENQGKCVAVFSHATPIRLLSARFQNVPVEQLFQVPFAPNASVTVVEYDEEGNFTLKLSGYDGHQGELSTSLAKGIV